MQTIIYKMTCVVVLIIVFVSFNWILVNALKLGTKLIDKKGLDRREDPDQTAPSGAV